MSGGRFARPVGLNYIRPTQANQANDLLKKEFFCDGGRASVGVGFENVGLKIYPVQKAKSPDEPTEAAAPTGEPPIHLRYESALTRTDIKKPAIVQKLTDAVNRVSKMPEVVQRLEQLYMAPLPASPAEFQQHIAAEVTRWRNVNKRLKLEF